MDKGAARSRKQAQRSQNPPVDPISRETATIPVSQAPNRTKSEPGPSRFKPKIIDNTDPSRFRPKAIRESAALIWSQEPFPLPPSPEVLSNVTRVDLAGSGCTDVRWLEGTKVTWLSLRGCKITEGLDAIATLEDLAVLNISDTDLETLPSSWSTLRNLKALVAMNLAWRAIDDDVIKSWTQLNSLIVSHSPNLAALPTSLQNLSQLSKLTFSHCPRLVAANLPDLSALPLLRDVKMNNLALLDKLPSHIAKWGTGPLPTTDREAPVRHGDGLQVLDLGNCSLPFSAIKNTFLTQQWPNLRSLSLHSNPLALTNPDFATLLQESDTLPHLQIIDSKRIVQRKRKGEVQESKIERRRREKKERKRTTGANMKESSGMMRVWGGGQDDVKIDGQQEKLVQGKADNSIGDETSGKRKRPAQVASAVQSDERVREPSSSQVGPAGVSKRVKRVKLTPTVTTKQLPLPTLSSTSAMPAAETSASGEVRRSKSSTIPKAKLADQVPQVESNDAKLTDEAKVRKRKNEGGKVETVALSGGGIDLKTIFAKPANDIATSGW